MYLSSPVPQASSFEHPACDHTHSVQVVSYLTDVTKKNGTCGSEITMLPSSALHLLYHGCNIGYKCMRTAQSSNDGFGHALNP